jgi:DNA-binding YbaB/EbfC family protein
MEMNFEDMLAKAQELRAKMEEAQEKLRAIETTVDVGGGMVSVTIDGKQEIRRIRIEKSVVQPDDVAMLEDLVVAAVNKAIAASKKLAEETIGRVALGSMPDIPGLDLGALGLK